MLKGELLCLVMTCLVVVVIDGNGASGGGQQAFCTLRPGRDGRQWQFGDCLFREGAPGLVPVVLLLGKLGSPPGDGTSALCTKV